MFAAPDEKSSDAASPTVVEEQQTLTQISEETKG